MPTRTEKNVTAATDTTGHEWDGIREYNNPLPKWWLYVFYATILWAIGYYVLYPSWPWVDGYMRGALGYSQRAAIEQTMANVRAAQDARLSRIDALTIEEIRKDPDLLNVAIAGGRAAFVENCAGCHGVGGAGLPGYPTLADDDWLWGGTVEEIQTTLLYGIRSGHGEARQSQMPAFGADNLLTRSEIRDVADYVFSLSGKASEADAAKRGQPLFAANCASCHGEGGQGDPSLGAPSLADSIWLYGSNKDAVIAQIGRPRHGVMPAWGDRLDATVLKMLAVYVHSLGGGRESAAAEASR